MLKRLYVHNFRCLENFELTTKSLPSILLIGKNGVGKSTIRAVLEIFQSISRGNNRIKDLVKASDFSRGRSDVPIRFEIDILLGESTYSYTLALAFSQSSEELQIVEEQLLASGKVIFSRIDAIIAINKTLILYSTPSDSEPIFQIDQNLAALPIIQPKSSTDPLHIFKTWLARMIIMAPIPRWMTGNSTSETLEPSLYGENFGEWFSGLLRNYPAAYTQIDRYLRKVMPDFQEILNESMGKVSKSMTIRFFDKNANLNVEYKNLSDGEKCFILCAVILAANKSYGPLFCFWDEPDNYLSISEVGHFVADLRRAFQGQSQIILTSHHPEAIRKFSHENTLVLDRKSHLEPTLITLLDEIPYKGDLISNLIRGDIE